MKRRNIFAGLPAARKKEYFRILKSGRNFKIERIVSSGQATLEGKWLCGRDAEWVIVLKGRGRLSFKGSKEKLCMKPGDYVFIPANAYHRVDWTDPGQKTVWLAVHLK